MYEIKVTDEFCGAHHLRDYKGKCEALHGHNWKVEVVVYSNKLDKKGMVMDFKKLKDKLKSILEALDHKYLNNLPYFKKRNPTSENIASFIHQGLARTIKRNIRVSVWETSNSCASFYTDGSETVIARARSARSNLKRMRLLRRPSASSQ